LATLDMDGPYELSRKAVQATVTHALPGTFAIGHRDRSGRFAVQYIGRDDANVAQALIQALGKGIGQPGLMGRMLGGKQQANAFKFSYANSAQAAYEKQCRSFHAFGETRSLENGQHPSPPSGSGLKCPMCGG
jgi:hypothetical protein